MTKPKNAPATPEAQSQTAATASEAMAQAEGDKATEAVTSVTNTGRVKVETKIRVQDFSEGGDAAPDIYGRKPDVEVAETAGNSGKKIKVENFV